MDDSGDDGQFLSDASSVSTASLVITSFWVLRRVTAKNTLYTHCAIAARLQKDGAATL